jgi:hypothetical protein
LFDISVPVISDIPPITTRIQEITVTEVGRIFIGFSNLPNIRTSAAALMIAPMVVENARFWR